MDLDQNLKFGEIADVGSSSQAQWQISDLKNSDLEGLDDRFERKRVDNLTAVEENKGSNRTVNSLGLSTGNDSVGFWKVRYTGVCWLSYVFYNEFL